VKTACRDFTGPPAASIIGAADDRLILMNGPSSKLRNRLWPRIGVSGAGLARASTFVLVLALVATITGWALEFSARRTPSEPVVPVTAGDSAPRSRAADVAPIAFLFGALPGADGSDIKLVGVIAQGKLGKGVALLAVDGRPPLALRAGEDIAAGVTLAEVRADRVVVSRSGALQEIRLPAKPAPDGIVKVR
jgi:general secretion pathway protein C